MAEKVNRLGLQLDHKQHLYYLSGEGHVMAKHKSSGEAKVLHANAVQRDNAYLYYIDKDGDVSRAARAKKKS